MKENMSKIRLRNNKPAEENRNYADEIITIMQEEYQKQKN